MSAPAFRSRWLDFTPGTREDHTAKTDRRAGEGASVGFVSDLSAALRWCAAPIASPPPPPALGRSEPLRFAGELAAEVNGHLEHCRVCRRQHFVTDNPAPLCRQGLELRRRYREARRLALGGAS